MAVANRAAGDDGGKAFAVCMDLHTNRLPIALIKRQNSTSEITVTPVGRCLKGVVMSAAL